MPLRNSRMSQKGFTLLEMALVMGIIGVVAVASVKFAIPLVETANHLSTTEKMKKIDTALSLYAIENNRVPCPAIPLTTTSNPFSEGFGYEQNNGTAQPNPTSLCGSSPAAFRGIVPFKTLGLSEDIAKDAWGNYFTYATSPFFAQPVSQLAQNVHARCRTTEWYYKTAEGGSPTSSQYRHRNPAKAAFCCSATPPGGLFNFNLFVRDDNNQNVLSRDRNYAMANTGEVASAVSSTANIYNLADPARYVPIDQTPLGIVFVLISHGKNGASAAFNVNTGVREIVPSATTNPCEEENADDATGDRIYRDCELSEDTETNANDDFTLWRTQDMMFASEGQSCATP